MIYLKAFLVGFFAAWVVAAGAAIGWHVTSMVVSFLTLMVVL